MRAVDVQSFAGGFTLGVSQAGFELAGKREMPGGFGVPSVAANEHNLRRSSDWAIEEGNHESWTPLGGLPFLFGNPPCSGFSGVSDKAFAGIDAKINDCMWELVNYAAKCGGADGGWGPEVIVYESVQNAYGKGLPLLRSLHENLRQRTGQDYKLYHVLHNAASVGGAAVRRRYFWVAARIPFGLAYDELERVPHLIESIGDLQGLRSQLEAQPYAAEATWWSKDKRRDDGLVDGHLWFAPQYGRMAQPMLDDPNGWYPGENLTRALIRWREEHDGAWPADDERFQAHYGPEGRNYDFGGAWQPERWYPDKMARVVTGGSAQRSLHPTEPRPLTLREMYRLQGFPDTWLIEPAVAMANANTATLWPGKGIPVQCGKWIAEQAKAAIEGAPRDDGRLRQLGEHEYVWDGTSDHRALYNEKSGERYVRGTQRVAVKTPRPSKTTDTTKETRVAKEPVAIGTNDPVAIKNSLLTTGEAVVDLAGLEEKEAKKARELLYGAAYSVNRKVKVRTDKAAQKAYGTLVPEGEERPPAPRPKPTPAPAPEPAWKSWPRHEYPDGTALRYDGEKWVAESELVTPTPVAHSGGKAGTAFSGQIAQKIIDANRAAKEPLPDTTEGDSESIHDLPDEEQACNNIEPAPELGEDGGEIEMDAATFAPAETGDEAQTLDPTQVYKLQPKTSKREVKDRRYDLTQLRAGSHGYYVHRDYASHYFRWGWASRHCKPDTRLLDLGSGQDLALARVLVYHNGIPESMVAVDLNKLQGHVQPKWLTVYDETNLCDPEVQMQLLEAHGPFNLITSFEVIEHMPPEDGDQLLGAIHRLLSDDGYALISTPVFNGKAAANHIHEYTIPELQEKIERAGFRVVERYGTFASYHDVKRGVEEWAARYGSEKMLGAQSKEALARGLVDFYEGCRAFYSDDVMANFMAPMLPDHSRNNAWKIVRA